MATARARACFREIFKRSIIWKLMAQEVSEHVDITGIRRLEASKPAVAGCVAWLLYCTDTLITLTLL
jgi:hypothetical protein